MNAKLIEKSKHTLHDSSVRLLAIILQGMHSEKLL